MFTRLLLFLESSSNITLPKSKNMQSVRTFIIEFFLENLDCTLLGHLKDFKKCWKKFDLIIELQFLYFYLNNRNNVFNAVSPPLSMWKTFLQSTFKFISQACFRFVKRCYLVKEPVCLIMSNQRKLDSDAHAYIMNECKSIFSIVEYMLNHNLRHWSYRTTYKLIQL